MYFIPFTLFEGERFRNDIRDVISRRGQRKIVSARVIGVFRILFVKPRKIRSVRKLLLDLRDLLRLFRFLFIREGALLVRTVLVFLIRSVGVLGVGISIVYVDLIEPDVILLVIRFALRIRNGSFPVIPRSSNRKDRTTSARL